MRQIQTEYIITNISHKWHDKKAPVATKDWVLYHVRYHYQSVLKYKNGTYICRGPKCKISVY